MVYDVKTKGEMTACSCEAAWCVHYDGAGCSIHACATCVGLGTRIACLQRGTATILDTAEANQTITQSNEIQACALLCT